MRYGNINEAGVQTHTHRKRVKILSRFYALIGTKQNAAKIMSDVTIYGYKIIFIC